MKDNYGDKLSVLVENDEAFIVSESSDWIAPGGEFGIPLTPAKARKLAKKLLKAADEAERTFARRGASSVAADAPETSSASLPDTRASSVEADAE